MSTIKPVAVVSPMKKSRKIKRKKGSKKATTDRSDISEDNRPALKRNIRKYPLPAFMKRLCTKVDNLDISPPIVINVDSQIPDHDRKILNRMATKLKRELSDLEMAHQAHIVWENEKDQREKLQKQQEEEYRGYIKAKRAVEGEHLKRKNKENEELNEWEREYLENIISSKDRAAEDRLKVLNNRKLNQIQLKQEMCKEKFENMLVAIRGKKFEEVLWRKELAEIRKQKNDKAELNREVLLRLSKQRAANDIKVHMELHKQNMDDQRMMELQQHFELKKRIKEKNEKMEYLRKKKEIFIKRSRQVADCTARMREDLKRSLSPDIYHKDNPWLQKTSLTDRSGKYYLLISPNHYDSHIKLG